MPPRIDDVVELSDGRRLGYAEWGPHDGRPVLQLHGSPAGRLDRWGADSMLDRLVVRLITVDRPGIGRSDPKPGRRVVDGAADVNELADRLGVGRFSVIGLSMGGAYAAACGAQLPDRVSAIGLVSSIGRVDEHGVDGMSVAPYLKLARRAPWAMRAVYTVLGLIARRSPARAHEQFWRGAPRADRDIVDRPAVRDRYWPALTDALAGRGRGLVDDMRAVQRPWGFDPREIKPPVHLFHGTRDRIVPRRDAQYWVETLPNCQVRWYEGEGHFLVEDYFEDILSAVVDSGG
jgi:pimeloyl-ACP methyl ester carboxylesterase